MMLKNWIKKEPYSLNLFITNKCNSKCKICNIWKQKPKVDLKAEDFHAIFSKSKLLQNVKQFNIAGGEFCLNKDRFEIVKTIFHYAKPYKVSFTTNGISSNLIPFLTSIRLNYGNDKIRIKISLDGRKEAYKLIRGVDAYDKVINNINSLIKGGYDVSIGFTITKDNNKEFAYLKKMFGDRMVAHPVDSIGYYNTNNGPSYLKLPKYKHKSMFFKLYSLYVDKVMNHRKRIHRCYAGQVSLVLDQHLNVRTCLKNPILLGNLKDYDYDFDKLWRDNRRGIKLEVDIANCYCYCAGDIIPSIIRDFRWLFK